MRKRQDLDNRIKTIQRIEQTISDNTELIALGEAEGDQCHAASGAHLRELLRGNHTESHTFFPGRFVFGNLPGGILSPCLQVASADARRPVRAHQGGSKTAPRS